MAGGSWHLVGRGQGVLLNITGQAPPQQAIVSCTKVGKPYSAALATCYARHPKSYLMVLFEAQNSNSIQKLGSRFP